MTMRVMSRPGRITLPGHVMTIVRNVVGADATNGIGRVRLLSDDRAGLEVSTLRCHCCFLTLGMYWAPVCDCVHDEMTMRPQYCSA